MAKHGTILNLGPIPFLQSRYETIGTRKEHKYTKAAMEDDFAISIPTFVVAAFVVKFVCIMERINTRVVMIQTGPY